MPRLPDASNLNSVNVSPAQSFTQIATPDISGAYGNLGQGLRNAGVAADQFMRDQLQRAQAQERFDTRMGLLTAKEAYYNQVKDLDPLDPQYVQKKQQAMKDTHAPVLSGVKDPENRQYFDASTYDDYVSLGISAEEEHKTARGKKAVFDITNFSDAQNRSIASGGDPSKAIAETDQMIDDSQDLDELTKLDLKRKNRLALATTGLQTKATGEFGNISGGAVVRAVVGAESSGDPKAVSPTGALGLMQVQPTTAAEIAVEINDQDFLKLTPKEQQAYLQREDVSLRYGTYYLNKQLKRYNGDLEAALIAYNAGPGNADKWLASGRDYRALPKPQETQPYVQKIFSTLGVDGSTAKQDPRLLANAEDVRSSIKSDPLFMQLPVDDQDKLLTSIDVSMKQAEADQQKYVEQGLFDTIVSKAQMKDPNTGENVLDPGQAYGLAKQIPDPATRKSVLSSIDAEVRRQDNVRNAEADAKKETAYRGVVDAMKAGDPAAAQKVIEDARLPSDADKSLREIVDKGLAAKDDEATKQEVYGLYIKDEARFLEATKDLTTYWGKLTFGTVMDLKKKRDELLKPTGESDKTATAVNATVRSASGKIDDKLREIGVDTNAKAGKIDNKYANFIRSMVVQELEKFGAEKAKAGLTPLDSEITGIVNGVFKSYPRAKASGGWFGTSVGADTDVDILEVAKEYEAAGVDIEAQVAANRAAGVPVDAATLLRGLDLIQAKKKAK